MSNCFFSSAKLLFLDSGEPQISIAEDKLSSHNFNSFGLTEYAFNLTFSVSNPTCFSKILAPAEYAIAGDKVISVSSWEEKPKILLPYFSLSLKKYERFNSLSFVGYLATQYRKEISIFLFWKKEVTLIISFSFNPPRLAIIFFFCFLYFF
mgnify:CR=1 FL=1